MFKGPREDELCPKCHHDERQLEIRKDKLVRDLTRKLDELDAFGSFHVILTPYGPKEGPGVRISIVKLDAISKKSEGQFMTLTYSRKKLMKLSVPCLVSGPFGQAKRLLMEAEKSA